MSEIWKSGELQKDIAKDYGVTRSAIGAIKNGNNWSWL